MAILREDDIQLSHICGFLHGMPAPFYHQGSAAWNGKEERQHKLKASAQMGAI